MTSASKTKPGISLLQRKWFLATVAVLVVVACAVVFAPVYLRGYVRGIVEREVGARVNGVVTVDAVRLGWFSPQTMVKPFADAVAALEKGKYTQAPVQSEFGWHVILLEDVRSPEVPDFEQVKPQVEMFTQRKKLQAHLEELRKAATVQK